MAGIKGVLLLFKVNRLTILFIFLQLWNKKLLFYSILFYYMEETDFHNLLLVRKKSQRLKLKDQSHIYSIKDKVSRVLHWCHSGVTVYVTFLSGCEFFSGKYRNRLWCIRNVLFVLAVMQVVSETPVTRFFKASGYTDRRFEAGVLTPGQRAARDSDDVAACTHWDLLCMQHRAYIIEQELR